MVVYTPATGKHDLKQIQQLQEHNLEEALAIAEVSSQGFVTVKHSIELLDKMNHPYPHILAKEDGRVIGYALVMLQEFKKAIPILQPMFKQIDVINYKGKPLKDTSYFVMGQICIAKHYRGSGIFKGLYAQMKSEMAPNFRYVITEVAKRNTRSLVAHQNVGFENIHEYTSDIDNEEWVLLLWDWRETT